MIYERSPLLAESALMPMIGMHTTSLVRQIFATGLSSVAWPSANRAFYEPVHIPVTTTVKRMWFAIGATGGTNQVDMGIYDAAGNRLVSLGSGTVVGTANTVQYLDVTDTTLPPGAYYIGISMNGTTATALCWNPGFLGQSRIAGVLQQATAFALPATMTGVALTAATVPLCGIATTASP